MPCELCGRDEPLQAIPDIYDRIIFKVCGDCVREHARVRPVAPARRVSRPQRVGGDETRRPRLPAEIGCPICHGDGGEDCPDCGATGGEWTQSPCSLCEGSGRYQCWSCKGSGRKVIGACATCGGEGKVTCEKCGGDGVEERKLVCPTCTGSGHLCHRCSGRGVIRLYS